MATLTWYMYLTVKNATTQNVPYWSRHAVRRFGQIQDTKGRHPEKKRLFFYKTYKRPLPPPPLVFIKLCCAFSEKKSQKVRKRPSRQKNA